MRKPKKKKKMKKIKPHIRKVTEFSPFKTSHS